MNSKEISNLRVNYQRYSLNEENIPKNPIQLFNSWFEDAIEQKVKEPNAMVVSTISSDQKPHARVVLLKGFSETGFEFYTNYNSNKGKQIDQNSNVALTFFYDLLERQINIEGKAVKLSREASEAYFHSRPKGSQIGAWVSKQSSLLDSRKQLEDQDDFYKKKFKDAEIIPIPDHWGGYLVQPTSIEFWQGRPNRLHDRILYVRNGENWDLKRLSP